MCCPARRGFPVDELSQAELRYSTRVDHHDHEALGALDDRTGRGVGVAPYVRHANDPQTAEIAVTVADAWQSLGLGTELLAKLADRARAGGIQRFTVLVAADDAAVAGLLQTPITGGHRQVRQGSNAGNEPRQRTSS